MAGKRLTGIAAVQLSGRELPDHDLLVAGAGDDEVALLIGRGDARDPVAVAREGTAEHEGVGHCESAKEGEADARISLLSSFVRMRSRENSTDP